MQAAVISKCRQVPSAGHGWRQLYNNNTTYLQREQLVASAAALVTRAKGAGEGDSPFLCNGARQSMKEQLSHGKPGDGLADYVTGTRLLWH